MQCQLLGEIQEISLFVWLQYVPREHVMAPCCFRKKLWILSLTSGAARDLASLTDSALLELDLKPFWNHHISSLSPWWISIVNLLWQEPLPTHHPLPPLGLAKRNPSKSNSNIFCDILSDKTQVWVRYPSFLFPQPLTLSYSVYFFYH